MKPRFVVIAIAMLAFFLVPFSTVIVTDRFMEAAAADPIPRGGHSPFHEWLTPASPPLDVAQEDAVNAAVDYVLSIIDSMGSYNIGPKKDAAIQKRDVFNKLYLAAHPGTIDPGKGEHYPFTTWPTGTNQLYMAQESFRIACVDYGYAVIDKLASTKTAARRAAVSPARDAFEAAYVVSQVPALPPIPNLQPWMDKGPDSNAWLIAQEQYEVASLRLAEAILTSAPSDQVESLKTAAATARANFVAIAQGDSPPDRTEKPGLVGSYMLPDDTNVFTRAEADYARACVDLVEEFREITVGNGRDTIDPSFELGYFDAMVARSVLEGVTDGQNVTAPTTTTMPAATVSLVRGAGAQPNPAPQPLAGHALAPIFTGTETYDDATDTFSPAPGSVHWYDTDELVLNYFEYHDEDAVPMCVEYSLDGGPWVAARYGRVEVPDAGEGDYQVRMVLWPSSGTNSVPLPPLVLKRLPNRADGSPFWWVQPPYGMTYVPPAKITSFKATPSTITAGDTVALTWTTENADKVTIDQGIGDVPLSGLSNVAPTVSTTYTLTATKKGVGAKATVGVFVTQPGGGGGTPGQPGEVDPPAGAPVMTLGTTAVTISATGVASCEPNPTAQPVAGHTMLGWDGSRSSAGVAYGQTALLMNLWENTANDGPVPTQVECSLNGGPWVASRGLIYMPKGLPDGIYQVRAVSWPAGKDNYGPDPAGLYTRIVTGTPPTKSFPWQPMYLKRATVNSVVTWTWYQ